MCQRGRERRRRVRGDRAVAAHHTGKAAHQKNRDFTLTSSLGNTLSSFFTVISTDLPSGVARTIEIRRSDPRSERPPARMIACATVVPVSSTNDPGFLTKPEI